MVHASPLLLVVPADNDDGEDDAQLLALYDGDTWILYGRLKWFVNWYVR